MKSSSNDTTKYPLVGRTGRVSSSGGSTSHSFCNSCQKSNELEQMWIAAWLTVSMYVRWEACT